MKNSVYRRVAIVSLSLLLAVAWRGTIVADQVILDDLIVDGSACIGLDCVNGEAFGFDTIRLKENNLRIKFQDTSSTASFPSNDWQITANDSANGGANKFSIDDITGGRTPFTILAGAPSNSLFVNASGRIGLKTSTPVVELHMADGDTPTTRLEQNGTSGFTPQTWDVAGNETNFFIRDVTNGSKLPFRIRPSAPTSSIDIASDGDVGIGTGSPQGKLHVENTSGNDTDDFVVASNGRVGIGTVAPTRQLHVQGNSAIARVENNSTTGASRRILELINHGSPLLVFTNTFDSRTWWMSGVGSRFVISKNASGKQFSFFESGHFWVQPTAGGPVTFKLDPSGNLVITGTLTQSSDVNAKETITAVDGQEVLSRLRKLPISRWSYKTGEPEVRHMGPMAQDFHAAFGLGADDRHIAPMDAAGVALAAIKELHEVVRDRDARIATLRERLSVLQDRVSVMEGMLSSLVQAQAKDDSQATAQVQR